MRGGAGVALDGDVNWLFPAYSKLSSNNSVAKVNNYIRSRGGKVSSTMYTLLLIIMLLQ